SNSDAVCESGTCDFECKPNFKVCGSACIPSTGCCMSNECAPPPATTCANATTVRTYATSGSCSSDSCSYAPTDTACDSPPAPSCVDSSTLRTFSAIGSCNAGVCSYTESTDTYCPGGCSDGACQRDVWIPTTVSGAPGRRSVHTAVWAGDLSTPKMIVWGGNGGGGGLYDPKADSWESMSTSGAPPDLWNAASVWTGSQMVVFGGGSNAGTSNAGGRFTPGSGGGTWQSMS